MTTTVPGYTMQVELIDPFGSVVGRGEIHVDEQVYSLDLPESGDEMATAQTAMRVGRYVQDVPPNPLLPASMRLMRR
jgi:hypothetical protein